jgi:hypothetical protein
VGEFGDEGERGRGSHNAECPLVRQNREPGGPNRGGVRRWDVLTGSDGEPMGNYSASARVVKK